MWLGDPATGGAGRLRLRRRLGHRRHQGEDRNPRPHLDALAELRPRRRLRLRPASTRPASRRTTARTTARTSSGSRARTATGGGDGDIRYSGMPALQRHGFARLRGRRRLDPALPQRPDLQLLRQRHLRQDATTRCASALDMVRMELNHWQPELGYGPRGYFGFGGGATTHGADGLARPVQRLRRSSCSASRRSVNKSIQYETHAPAASGSTRLYVRDRWQVNKKLTLNLGLRYELYPLMTRADRGIEYYDATTNRCSSAASEATPRTWGSRSSTRTSCPGSAFSYRLTRRTTCPRRLRHHRQPDALSRPLRGFYPQRSPTTRT